MNWCTFTLVRSPSTDQRNDSTKSSLVIQSVYWTYLQHYRQGFAYKNMDASKVAGPLITQPRMGASILKLWFQEWSGETDGYWSMSITLYTRKRSIVSFWEEPWNCETPCSVGWRGGPRFCVSHRNCLKSLYQKEKFSLKPPYPKRNKFC